MPEPSRRAFMVGLPVLAWGVGSRSARTASPPGPTQSTGAGVESPASAVTPGFPRLDADLVRTFVGVCHVDLAEVTRLVERQPSLARASWDWGFGDWETGLGAAAHTGRRPIAEVVLAHGARPTLFSAAMMGQLAVVRAFVEASPGLQRTLGPHGLTLLAHARAGGADAEPVVRYLERVGGADVGPRTEPLAASDRDAVVGQYGFGATEAERLDVDVRSDQLGIARPGATRRVLFHAGGLVFFPAGVPSVRIAFHREAGRVTHLTVADPDVYVTARRR